MTEYIEAHLTAPLTLAELAALAAISPRHFTRLFRSSLGMAPHQYVIARRVERAKRQLAETEGSLAAIAHAVGFADQSHLSTHFRRHVGVTPARYRAESA